jgi:type VI secretion system Hcp family effector
MAINAYVTVFKTKKAGDIEGESTVTTCAGVDVSKSIELHFASFGVSVGAEAHESRHQSHRTWKRFEWMQRTDKSVPLLYQALCSNDPADVTVEFFQTRIEDANVENHLAVKLEGARVASCQSESPNTFDHSTATIPFLTRVGLVFRKITITHKIASKEIVDDWRESL